MMRAMRVVFLQECRLLYRDTQTWVAPFCFFALILFLFPLAFPFMPVETKRLFPGCVWIVSVFANCFSLQTLFLSDLENNSLEQWALSPTPFSLLLTAKLAAYWLATQLPSLALTLLLSLLLNLDNHITFVLMISLLLSSPVIVLLCSLSLALTLGLKQPGAVLGLMLIPLMIPVVMLGCEACELASLGLGITHCLAAIAGLSLLSLIALPPALAYTLRLGMDH